MSSPSLPIPDPILKQRRAFTDTIAHAFIFYGATWDYILPRVYLTPYLKKLYLNRVCVEFSRAHGFKFKSEDDEKEFRKRAGYDEPSSSNDPFAPAEPRQKPLPSDVVEALTLIDKFLWASNGDALVIIGHPETIAPGAPFAQLGPVDRTAINLLSDWSREPALGERQAMIFLLAENLEDLHPAILSARFEPIEFPMPDRDSRLGFIRDMERIETIRWVDDFSPEELANMTSGLGLVHIDDILMRGQGQGAVSRDLVRERKNVMFRTLYANVLEPIESDITFADLGGYDYLKEFFRGEVIEPVRAGRWKEVPKGVLMMGPAGTGKSTFAYALANEIGFQAVKLNFGGQIASMWQGEGERNLRRALKGMLTMAPVLVFIDEIESSVNRAGAGNQQDARLFQMFNEFLADESRRGKVIVVAATNRPDLLDAAFKRTGRWDLKVLVTLPDAAAIQEIAQLHLKRLGLPTDGDLTALKGYTPAEIRRVCEIAKSIAREREQGRSRPGFDELTPLQAAVRAFRPTTQDIPFMDKLALAEVDDLRFLPPQYTAALLAAGNDPQKASDALEQELSVRRTRRGGD